jgi:hypothetical protein
MTFDHNTGQLNGQPRHYLGKKPRAFVVRAYNQYGTGTTHITIKSAVHDRIQKLEKKLQRMQKKAAKLQQKPAFGTVGLVYPSLQCKADHSKHEHRRRRLRQEEEQAQEEQERKAHTPWQHHSRKSSSKSSSVDLSESRSLCVVWLLQHQPISRVPPVYYGVAIDFFTVSPPLPPGLRLNR